MEILWANCNNLFELKPQIILKALYSPFCFLLASQSIWVNSLLRATLRYPYECLTIFRRGKKAESTLLSHIFGFPFESKVFVACIICSMLILWFSPLLSSYFVTPLSVFEMKSPLTSSQYVQPVILILKILLTSQCQEAYSSTAHINVVVVCIVSVRHGRVCTVMLSAERHNIYN